MDFYQMRNQEDWNNLKQSWKKGGWEGTITLQEKDPLEYPCVVVAYSDVHFTDAKMRYRFVYLKDFVDFVTADIQRQIWRH